MARIILDTNILIKHWHDQRLRSTVQSPSRWAKVVIHNYGTNYIVTPVRIEFLSGTRSASEDAMAREFLAEFSVLDKGHISDRDWQLAEQIARRVPQNGKPRQLGDCLVLAIAKRFGCAIVSADKIVKRGR